MDKPEPPDMAEVVQRYEMPQGTFDAQSAAAMLDVFTSLEVRALELGLHQEVLGWLQSALAAPSGDGQAGQGAGTQSQPAPLLEANGTLLVERICAGWSAQPIPDAANGVLTIRVNFSEEGVDPVIWGEAQACRYLVAGAAAVRIDQGSGRTGDVRIWLGRSTTFESFGRAPMIFDVDLTVETGGVVTLFATDFRLDPLSDHLAFAVEAPLGNVVISRSPQGSLEVVAINGTFQCDLASRQCSSDAGTSFSF